MEVLSRRVDFAFGISSWKGNPYLVNNSKRRVKINGCSLFSKPFGILSSPVLTARCRKTTVMATFKRANEAPRRRNALRHKLMEQQEQVRQPNLEVHDKAFGENDILPEENFSQYLEKKFSEGLSENLERDSSEGMGQGFGEGLSNSFSEGLKERLAEGFKEGLEEVPEGELKDTLRKMWNGLESLNSELEKKPKVKNVFEVAKSGKARGEKLGEAFAFLVGGIRVPPIVKFSFFGLVFVYGCFLLWAVRKYLFSDVPLEKKAFEEDRRLKMLMRKKKARMEKETTERYSMAGNDGRDQDFKVLKEKDAVYESGELVKEVGHAYKGDSNLNEADRKKRFLATTSLSKGKLSIDDREFDEKVQMIRSMAREARMMEQKNKLESEKFGTDVDENADGPRAANGVLDPDGSRNASGLDPRDVSLLASTLKFFLDNDKTDKKLSKTASRKDEHSNTQNGIVAVSSNSSNVESGSLTDANAADNSELNKLSPVSDSRNKVNTKVMQVKADAKDSMPVDVSASSVTFMDSKGDTNGISNGVFLMENKQPLMENEIITEVRTTKIEDFNVQNSIVSKKLDVEQLSSSNKVGSVNAVESNGLDASAYVVDSVNKGKTYELKSVDYKCASAAVVLNSKGGEDISDEATSKEGEVDFHDQSVDSNGAEVNKHFAHREKSGNIANMHVTEEDSQRESSGHNSLIYVNEKAEAQMTGQCEEPMPQNRTTGAVIGQEPKAKNGKVLNKCDNISIPSSKASRRMMPRVITSVEEARAILASKRGKHSNKTGEIEQCTALNGLNGRSQEYDLDEQIVSNDPFNVPSTDSFLLESSTASNSSAGNKTETSIKGNFEKFRPPFKKDMVRDIKSQWEGKSKPNTTISKVAKNEENSESDGINSDGSISEEMQNEPENSTGDGKNSEPPEEAEDFDWMKNDVLRDIVFKVKANEDAGKEPFDGLDSKDKDIFCRDIRKRIEREEDRVNKWVGDKVENLDYGKDGIAYDDPPEVFQARWKDQDKMHNSSFIDKFKEERENIIKSKMELYHPVSNETEKSSRSAKSASSASSSTNSTLGAHNDSSVSSKTVISSSGKSKSFGKKSRKKSWQHTKKWSRSLQEMYIAERDPQVKGLIKDMGQDLERWTTKEEMEEVSQMLEKPPEEQLKDFERITARIKSEREKFGEEAVISKYSEYKPEKEDHLWWIDLPYVLCVELSRNIDGQMMKGLYSLEMAADIEPRDKHLHVVAFEDRGDAKKFCYMLRTRLENGQAHVMPCHPKEIYREAQSEGYKVTVIKKEQIEMYIDKPFEEVVGIVTEIGSEMYYDRILQDRLIDMDCVLKDGFGNRSHMSK